MKKLFLTLALLTPLVRAHDTQDCPDRRDIAEPQTASESVITVRLKNLESYEIRKSNQAYTLLHDVAHNIRTTFERIIELVPKTEMPISLELIKQRIDLGYITAPLIVIKEAVEQAYQAVTQQISALLTPQESEQLRSSLQEYYDSIAQGEFTILPEAQPEQQPGV